MNKCKHCKTYFKSDGEVCLTCDCIKKMIVSTISGIEVVFPNKKSVKIWTKKLNDILND